MKMESDSTYDSIFWWILCEYKQHLKSGWRYPCCKLLIEVNAVVWKPKQTTLTEKGSYFSYTIHPLIICKLHQNLNWRLTALIDMLYNDTSFMKIGQPIKKLSHFCRQATDFVGVAHVVGG
jgi:hypothetical protein